MRDSGLQELRVREIPPLQNTITQGIRINDHPPTMFAKHCQVKKLKIPKTHTSLLLWCRQHIPRNPMKRLSIKRATPPEIRKARTNAFANLLIQEKTTHAIV
jgi:hypothetical protein